MEVAPLRPFTLLFQRPDWALVLLAWREIRACDAIQFFQFRDLSASRFPELPGPALRAVVRWLNPRARFNPLSNEDYLSLWLENNLASDKSVEEAFEPLSRSLAFRRLESWAGSRHGLDRYYKIWLLPGVLAEGLYSRIARHFKGQRNRLVLIPSALPAAEWRPLVPGAVWFALQVRTGLLRLLRLLTLSNPLLVLARCAQPILRLLASGRLTLARPRPLHAEVVAPITSGFDLGPFRGGRHSDSFLLDSNLTADRVLFYFSNQRFSPEEKLLQTRWMERMGIRYADPGQFRADPQFLWQALRFCAFLVSGLVRPAALLEDPRSGHAAGAFGRNVLEELLFARYVRFRVRVELQDYSLAHVARTIVAHRFGGVTVAMHHGSPAAPWVFPVLRYTFVDRQCVWGEAFLRMHEGHWDRALCVPVGCYRLDAVLVGQREKEALQCLYGERFGGQRPLILLLLPSLSWYILPARVQELLEGLRLLKELPGDFQIVCRFRQREQREQWLQRGLAEILERDRRVREDTALFSTPEWMALSDLVISSNHSTGMIEAAGSNKPCASFDFMLTAEKVFGRYGPNLVLKTRNDLVAMVRAAQEGRLSSAGGATRLAQDFSFYADGRNAQRFRSAVAEMVGS